MNYVIWVDDVRKPPNNSKYDYIWFKYVSDVKQFISTNESLNNSYNIVYLDLDHDSGGYGPDYIKLLDWLEATGRNYPIRIHSQNPVGIANMRRIIERNGWKEVF